MRITSGKWQLAIGIDWSMPENAIEVRKAKKENAKRLFVSASTDKRTWLGFHDDVRRLRATHAGALLIGMVQPDAVVCVALSRESAWLCVVREGMPVVGHDRIVPLVEAQRLGTDWLGMFDGATLASNLHEGALPPESLLQNLEESLAGNVAARKRLAAAVLRSQVTATQVGIRLAIAIAVAGACLYAWQGYARLRQSLKDSSEMEQRQVLESGQEARLKQKREADRRQQNAKFDEQAVRMQRAYAQRPRLTDFWAAAAQVRGTLPVSQYGYRPQSVECSVTECKVLWMAHGANVSPADKFLLPNIRPATLSDPLPVSLYPIAPGDEALPATSSASPEELQVLLVSLLARRVHGLRITPLQEVSLPPPPGSGLAPVMAAHVGTWQVSISGPAALVKARDAIRLMEGLPVRMQVMKFAPQQGGVELSGDYVFLPKTASPKPAQAP
jgi:hypothetical protein